MNRIFFQYIKIKQQTIENDVAETVKQHTAKGVWFMLPNNDILVCIQVNYQSFPVNDQNTPIDIKVSIHVNTMQHRHVFI